MEIDAVLKRLLATYQRDRSGRKAREYIKDRRAQAVMHEKQAQEFRKQAAICEEQLALLMREDHVGGVRRLRRSGETPSLNGHIRDQVFDAAWSVYGKHKKVRLQDVLAELRAQGVHVEGAKAGTSVGQIINRSEQWNRVVSGLWDKPTAHGTVWHMRREKTNAARSAR